MAAPEKLKSIRITSPQKIEELLRKVAISGSPLIIKPNATPGVSVRGRAVPDSENSNGKCLKIANISARGFEHLSKNYEAGFQIEFVLASIKIVFVTTLVCFQENACVVNFPAALESIERRKEARIPAVGNSRAYVSINSWTPDACDSATIPFFESSRDLVSLIMVGDISAGGLSLVSRFPAVCRALSSTNKVESALFHLPMQRPLKIMAAIRWTKKTSELTAAIGSADREIISYRFGIQFLDVSDEVTKSLKQFLASAALADAI